MMRRRLSSYTDSLRLLAGRHPLGFLVFIGVLFRIALLPFVKVSADTSLYTYDAMLVLEDQTPISDYPTRSPLFSYLYAIPLALGAGKMVTARITMLLAGIAVGLAVYHLTTVLASRRVAFAATLLYYVTPLSIVYGLQLYTEQFTQLIVIAGVLLLYKALDAEVVSYRSALAIGVLFGIAFLIRRVVLVQFGVLGLFVLYYWTAVDKRPFLKIVGFGCCLVIGMGTSLTVGYLALTWPSISDAFLIAEQQILWLFQGSPVGNVAWVEMTSIPTAGGASAAIGFPSLRTLFIKLTHLFAVSLPVALPLLIIVRSVAGSLSLPKWIDTTLCIGLVGAFLVGGVGRWLVFPLGTVRPALVGLVGALTVVVLWRRQPVLIDELWDPRLGLMIGFSVLVVAGYFALGTLGFVHFLDTLPYLSVIAGILVVRLADASTPAARDIVPTVGATILMIAVVVALVSTTALVTHTGIEDGSSTGLDTMAEVAAVNDDLETRLDDGSNVLVAQPMYIFESGLRQTGDLSRGYWIIREAPESAPADRLTDRLLARLDDGNVKYVILDKWTRTLLEKSPALASEVEAHFCPIADDGLYESSDATLYVRTESAASCQDAVPIDATGTASFESRANPTPGIPL